MKTSAVSPVQSRSGSGWGDPGSSLQKKRSNCQLGNDFAWEGGGNGSISPGPSEKPEGPVGRHLHHKEDRPQGLSGRVCMASTPAAFPVGLGAPLWIPQRDCIQGGARPCPGPRGEIHVVGRCCSVIHHSDKSSFFTESYIDSSEPSFQGGFIMDPSLVLSIPALAGILPSQLSKNPSLLMSKFLACP